jgi:hypothetical protein
MDPPWPNPAASKRKTDAARDRSTLVFWVGVAAAEVKPVYQRLKQILLRLAAVDETRAPVLDPAAGKPGTSGVTLMRWELSGRLGDEVDQAA